MNRGILAFYRDKFNLVKSGWLSEPELVLYEYCISIADFDVRHVNFGTFSQLINEKLGTGLGWKVDKTRRNFRNLIEKGLLRVLHNDRVKVVGFDRYLPTNAFEQKEITVYLLTETAKVRSENAKMLEENANLPNQGTVLDTKATVISDIGSYKVNTVLRSIEEYEEIVKGLGFTSTDASDLAWIDNWIKQRPHEVDRGVQGGKG